MFKQYSRSTTTHYKCGKCGKKNEDARSQVSVYRLPQVLVIQLHRFYLDDAVSLEQRASTVSKVSLQSNFQNCMQSTLLLSQHLHDAVHETSGCLLLLSKHLGPLRTMITQLHESSFAEQNLNGCYTAHMCLLKCYKACTVTSV